ncbi:hypothetical protein BLNAU_15213 [Blattamonas nauphoetae]|uniref:Uncharacterized protein n=1 Tax=Blattamonas nauphoetae TaxID=2049346 RepID=A0ABQ9XEU0_9EUKA|nr:hypothetical protein BLNAU_15213 [Blattamonas nauphoetae]
MEHLVHSVNDENKWDLSNISSLLERLQCNDEEMIVDTLRTLQKVASGAFFCFSHRYDLGFFNCDEWVSESETDDRKSSHPSAVGTTLARMSLSPHLGIATHSLNAIYWVVTQDPPALTPLPSPIFPSSSPIQQYSGLSFLAALTKKLRIVFSKFQATIPTDPSHLPKFIQLTKDDPFLIYRSLDFCSCSFILPNPLLRANPPIEVDSQFIRELVLFVKEALPTILTNISTIDNLIASLPSDSSPTTQLYSEADKQATFTLKYLKSKCEVFMSSGWLFLMAVPESLTDSHKSSIQTIILDDPSFPDLVLNSLKCDQEKIRKLTIMTITDTIIHFPWMREQFMTANLVGRMFETVDFVSLPLSESETHIQLSRFITWMFFPVGYTEEHPIFEQYPLIRVSVLEPAKEFIKSMFHNSDKLILNEADQKMIDSCISLTHHHIRNMDLRLDELDADIVSAFVNWEVRTMVAMEDDSSFCDVFDSMFRRLCEWTKNKPERLKRREVLLREEGWDDALELRVVGIEVDTSHNLKTCARQFRIKLTLNADEL